MPKLLLMAAVKFVTWVLCFPYFSCVSLASSSTITTAVPCTACESCIFETKGQLMSVSLWRRGLWGSGPCLPLPLLGHPKPCSRVARSVLLAGCQVWPFRSVASAVLSRYGGCSFLTELPICCLCLCCKFGL